MKTLNANNKRILFGMLIVTLGFSKSWFQAANMSDKVDLASASKITTDITAQIVEAEEAVDVTVGVTLDTFETTKTEKDWKVVNGVPTYNGGTETETITKASFDYEGCNCISSFILEPFSTTDEANEQLRRHIKKDLEKFNKKTKEEKVKKDKEEKDAKELAEAIANCEKAQVGDKIIDLQDDKHHKHLGKYYSCKAEKITAEDTDRDDRRSAFQREIVDDLQERLLNSTSDAERRDILSAIREIKKEVRGDKTLARDLKFLEKGAKALAEIPGLAQDSSLNPSNELQNNLSIDRLAWEFNFATNPQLNMYNADTRNMIRDWSNEILPLAKQAQRDPELITAQFFNSYMRHDGLNPGMDNRTDGNYYSGDSRFTRVDMGGMQYIPRYLDGAVQNTLGDYRNNSGSRYSSSDQRFADPRSVDPRLRNGNVSPNGSRYAAADNRSRYATSEQGPGYTRGGIPQAGRRY